jgi:hypothetical protein
MQLRDGTTIRVPGRYTEYDIPPSPGVATFVHPTIPYNPGLPPAAFPTLDFPRAIKQPTKAMAVLDSSDSASRQETPILKLGMQKDVSAPRRRAIVFYDKRISPEVSPFTEQTGFEASTPSWVNHDALQRLSEKSQDPGRCCCDSFEHLSSYDIGEKSLGLDLEVSAPVSMSTSQRA